MGWLFMSRFSMGGFATPRQYLDDQFTYSREVEGKTYGLRVIGSACVANRVYYAACEPTKEGKVGPAFAIICLVRWNPRSPTGEHFGYKDLSEDMGPCEASCPARILDLLGPTDHKFAIQWRAACRAALAKRKRPLPDGGIIRFAEPIRFTDGFEGQEFTIEKSGGRLCLISRVNRGRYKVSRLHERDWQIIPQPKVHAAVFPPRA
jgi:hypothetical protein